MNAAGIEKLRRLTLATGYGFCDETLGLKSLHAAGAIDQDGNRLLAMKGDVLLKLFIVEEMSKRGLSRGEIQETVSRVASNAFLSAIGRCSGIGQLIIKNNSQRFEPPSATTVAIAVEAILAAVWDDTNKDLEAVGRVMINLGLWPEF